MINLFTIKKILVLKFFSIIFFLIFISFSHGNENQVCTGGFTKWTDDGELKQIREVKCISEQEYKKYISSKDYLCKYYQKSIWKESEREYGKKQYKYTEEKLTKIKALKDEGKALCDAGKLKEAEEKLEEAIKIISFTMMN